MSTNPHIGSSLDDFLKEERLYEDATGYAVTQLEIKRGETTAIDQQPSDQHPPSSAGTNSGPPA